MSSIIEAKFLIKNIYGKYEAYFNPIVKFVFSLIVLLIINGKIGYMERIDSFLVVLVAALFCSFVPTKIISLVFSLFILLHMYALALECLLVVGVVFVLMFLVYARFVPDETLAILITPILFMLKIPYIMPLAMGLIGGPVSFVSVSCGLVIGYLLDFLSLNSSTILTIEDGNMVARLRFIVDGLLGNKAMFVMIIAFAITLIVVYIIRRQSIDYSWAIAIASGAILDVVILLMGDMVMDLNYSIVGILFGSIFAAAVACVVMFFDFHVDYRRAENLQFEDEEYYYYVKAIPKITLGTSNKKVKRISGSYDSESDNYGRTVRTSNGASRTIR